MQPAANREAPGPPDAELLARLEARDPSALEQLYDRYAGYALAAAQRILRDRAEAEEVVQDVFLQLWRSRVRYDERRGRFRSWLFVLARNRALDRLRQRGSRPRGEPPTGREVAPGADAEQRVLAGERERRVLQALAALPAGQREAIELSFYRGLSHSEIALQLAEPIGTVKSRMHRAMLTLREILGGVG
jgi:RNA polymerase sigma-70 factor (ECF subfamily)